MTTDITALVPGSTMAKTDDATIAVYVLRAFMHKGAPVAVGTSITLPATDARELIAMNKVSRIPATAPVEVDVRRRGRPAKEKE
jgi:hypothetical protein